MIPDSEERYDEAPVWKAPARPLLKTRTVIIAGITVLVVLLVGASLIHPEPIKNAFESVKTHFTNDTPVVAAVEPAVEEEKASISEDARNSTLGFQKVYYISLPQRTDRQDAMTLLSDMIGIDSEHVEGVDGSATSAEAKIIGSKLKPGVFGCWRSHANVWRKMLQDKVSTALIMEDDVDFDVNIKDQLFRISEGIQSGPRLVDINSTEPVDSSGPYGVDWDLFFVGYCAHTSPKEANKDNTPYITFPDPTVIDLPVLKSKHSDEFKKFDINANQTRLVVPLYSYYCTQGYAISQRGARRLLYLLGYKDVTSPVDNVMSWKTQDGLLNGIAPVPPLISQFKVGHNIDSNINGKGEHKPKGDVDKESGHGFDIMNSARVAMKEWAVAKNKKKRGLAGRLWA